MAQGQVEGYNGQMPENINLEETLESIKTQRSEHADEVAEMVFTEADAEQIERELARESVGQKSEMVAALRTLKAEGVGVNGISDDMAINSDIAGKEEDIGTFVNGEKVSDEVAQNYINEVPEMKFSAVDIAKVEKDVARESVGKKSNMVAALRTLKAEGFNKNGISGDNFTSNIEGVVDSSDDVIAMPIPEERKQKIAQKLSNTGVFGGLNDIDG